MKSFGDDETAEELQETTKVFTVPISSITDALHPPRDKVMAAANVGGFAEASRCFTQSRSFP